MLMKRFSLFFTAVCICLCSCSQLQEDDSVSSSPSFWEIWTMPGLNQCTIGKEGGEFELTAFVHEWFPADSLAHTHQLKNEYFYFGSDLEGKQLHEVYPFVSLKNRIQVDDYTVRYTFLFEENKTGEERHLVCRIYDLTYYKDYRDGRGFREAGIGNILITQTAD